MYKVIAQIKLMAIIC